MMEDSTMALVICDVVDPRSIFPTLTLTPYAVRAKPDVIEGNV